MDYDVFQVGDRVWSEVWGFGEVGMVSIPTQSVVLSIDSDGISFSDSCTFDGRHHFCRKRHRYVFHAVADTDEGMRAAIARGEGLKRPVPRGRWPIEPGDRVMVYSDGEHISCLAKASGDREFPISVNGRTYTKSGKHVATSPCPHIMRLFPGEELFADPCENLRWRMDEAIKFGWYEKYGK